MPRPPILDDYKRREILALASVGLSRRAMAEYVGCAANTIENTARRDPAFARQLQSARAKFIYQRMRSIQQQARSSWRASTWLLERADPDNFGHRPPNCITPRQQARQFRDWAQALARQVEPSLRPALESESAKLARELFGDSPQAPHDDPDADDFAADESAADAALLDAETGQPDGPASAVEPDHHREGWLPRRRGYADDPAGTGAPDEEDFIPPDVGHFDFSDPNWILELLANRGTATVPAPPAPATDRPSQSAPPAVAPNPLVPPAVALLLCLLLGGVPFVSPPGRTAVHAAAAPRQAPVIEHRPPISTASAAKIRSRARFDQRCPTAHALEVRRNGGSGAWANRSRKSWPGGLGLTRPLAARGHAAMITHQLPTRLKPSGGEDRTSARMESGRPGLAA